MVVKPKRNVLNKVVRFENGVVSYGGQTRLPADILQDTFENGVVSYGGQTNRSS